MNANPLAKQVKEGRTPQPVVLAYGQGTDPVLAETLTRRELEVLYCVADGMEYKEIGARLGISAGTCRVHLANIMGKLHCQTRTRAVVIALQMGWLQLPEASVYEPTTVEQLLGMVAYYTRLAQEAARREVTP